MYPVDHFIVIGRHLCNFRRHRQVIELRGVAPRVRAEDTLVSDLPTRFRHLTLQWFFATDGGGKCQASNGGPFGAFFSVVNFSGLHPRFDNSSDHRQRVALVTRRVFTRTDRNRNQRSRFRSNVGRLGGVFSQLVFVFTTSVGLHHRHTAIRTRNVVRQWHRNFVAWFHRGEIHA